MNNALTIPELVKIKNIMEKMLVEAQQANWTELNRLDSERRSIIQSDKNYVVDPNVKSTMSRSELSILIRKLDDTVNDVVLTAKKNLLQQNRHHTKQVAALRGYAKASLDYS